MEKLLKLKVKTKLNPIKKSQIVSCWLDSNKKNPKMNSNWPGPQLKIKN